MSPDTKMVILFAAMHLIGLGLVSLLLVMFLRSDTVEPWSPPGDDEGGGGPALREQPRGSPSPGGLPLPDAVPARVRLREAARLADLLPKPGRRPAREPEREPVPHGQFASSGIGRETRSTRTS